MTCSPRRQKVADLLVELDLDALVFCKAENIRYLSNFSGSDGALIAFSDQLVFLTDSRYTTQAHAEVAADSICEYTVKVDGIIEQIRAQEAVRIGFEAELPYRMVKELRDKGDVSCQWLDYHEELHGLRMHKSPEEILRIDAAASLHASALSEVAELIRPGQRELDVSMALEFALRRLGADEKAFDIIVASGVRGALPHGIASEKILNEGELVTIDFGCRLEGYHSDETVTLAIGDVPEELKTIYGVVLEAHDLALSAVVPGIALVELDRIARDHIKASGYGKYFGHGLGHGVGLEIHEAPTLSPRSKSIAEAGMVFTIEPGIYVPGLGGVRIEDMVLVTAQGRQVLTKIPKTFRNILIN